MSKIILFSGKAEHGKTTARNMIASKMTSEGMPHLKVSYGDYLKFVAATYYGWDGNKNEDGRKLLQWLGTDYVKSIDKNFWVDSVIRLVEIIGKNKRYILIDDCRFKEEVYRWNESDFITYVIRVNRPHHVSKLTPEQLLHPSETSMDYFGFDECMNARNQQELWDECCRIYGGLL